MKKLVLLVLVLAALALAAPSGGVVSRDDFKRAQVLAEGGKWEEALKVLAPILKQDPRYSDALYLEGVCYLGLKDYARARKSFVSVTSLEPGFMPAYQMVGSTYLSEKNYVEARKYFEKMLMMPGGMAPAQYSLGVVAYAQQNLVEAQKHWKEAIQTNPSLAAPHNNLGICYQLAGNNAMALAEFQDAFRLAPENPYYKFNLGVQLLKMNRQGEAKRYLTEVMQQNTRDDLSVAAAAYLAAQAGKPEDAVKLCTMALAKNEELSMVLMLQAQQHEKLKQADKAREAYQKALDSDPNLDEARKALARLTPAPEVSPSPAPEASPLPLPRLTPTEPPDGGGSVAPPQQVPEPGSPPDLIPVPEATPPHREND